MRIQDQCKLREIAGEQIIVHQAAGQVDLTRIISLNATATELFRAFAGRDFEVEEVAAYLVQTYGIAQAEARRDAGIWIQSLLDCEVISS